MLQTSSSSYQITQTLNAISILLTDICDESTQEKDTNPKIRVQPFLSKKIPSISISNYLSRLIKYTSIEYSTMETMLILIDRFCDRTRIVLNYFNIHNSLIVAIKLNEDLYFQNIFYAKVGGVPKKEINKLEYEFLAKMDFDVHISEELYQKYHNYLEKTNENMILEEKINNTCIHNKHKQKDIMSENDDNTTEGGEIEQWER